MRDILKYLVIMLVVVISGFIFCNVLVAIWPAYIHFIKWLAYLGLILDKGNITSISAVLK
jgi:hypothetical protein